jgi:hypothetical protein
MILTNTITHNPPTHVQEFCASVSWRIASCPDICFYKDRLIDKKKMNVQDIWCKASILPVSEFLPNPTPSPQHRLFAQMKSFQTRSHSSFVKAQESFSLHVCVNSSWLSQCEEDFSTHEGDRLISFQNLIQCAHIWKKYFYWFDNFVWKALTLVSSLFNLTIVCEPSIYIIFIFWEWIFCFKNTYTLNLLGL